MLAKHTIFPYDICFAEEAVYLMDKWNEKIAERGTATKRIEVKYFGLQAELETEKNMVIVVGFD